MANYALLNNVEHAELKIVNRYFKESGDCEAAVVVFPTEFVEVQREYPIFLSFNSNSGEYKAVALFGLQKGENLFLDSESGSWKGAYVPSSMAKGPFLIGYREQPESTHGDPEPMVYVDLDSPKVSTLEGESLFLEHGGNAPYLNYISGVLQTIYKGLKIGRSMFRTFDELGLIESVDINIEFKNGERQQLGGYFTVSEEKLSCLDGESLAALNRSGYLQGAFLIVASLSNVRKLIDKKNLLL